MSHQYTIRTNNIPRDIIDAWELSPDEREEFDYINWSDIDSGSDSASFLRYRGELYDLSGFMSVNGLRLDEFKSWDGYAPDSFFSGIVIRYCDDYDRVIIGTYCR